jgi:hypothetical protein
MICASLTILAQSKLDLSNQAQLRRYRIEQNQGPNGVAASPIKKSAKASVPTGTGVLALVKIADGADAHQIEQEGAEVLAVRGNIAIVSMAVDDVERVADLSCIERFELSKEQFAKLDLAREVSGVNKVHQGLNLPSAYTGKGVITGIVDSGMDPNHINFKNEDGTSRIRQLTYVRANAAGTDAISTYYGDDYPDRPISLYTTDSNESYHGSHTMGIMAGGYRGQITYPKQVGEHDVEIVTEDNPYYGVAYNSDIVASCGTLGDGYIALGVEHILDYAYLHEQPAVINLSLGSNSGPHDGRAMLNRYLELAGEEAIICVSAGNEGNLPIAITKNLTANDNKVQSFFYPDYYGKDAFKGTDYYKINYGAMYFYSDTEEDFEIQAVIYNKSRGRIAQRFTVPVGATLNKATYYISSSDYQQSSDDVVSQQLANYFKGYLGVGVGVDEGTQVYEGEEVQKRYYALIDVYLQDNTDGQNADGNYILGFIVTGKDGQRIDCYSDALATSFTSYGIDGWMDGSTNGSISDMACGKNVIVVGSYNERDDFGFLGGYLGGYEEHYYPGEISNFSSYGTLINGKNLPHVCAPGASLISSTNNYYLASTTDVTEDMLQGKLETADRNYYWEVAAGTSMSCPFVAGSIALWLEANPTLTFDDVLNIIEKTSIKDSYVTDANSGVDPIQWGAGKFDAYEGLKEALRMNSVNDIAADKDSRLMLTNNGSLYNVFVAGEQSLKVDIFSMTGQRVYTSTTIGDEASFDTSSLTKGVYVVSVNGVHNQKIAIK